MSVEDSENFTVKNMNSSKELRRRKRDIAIKTGKTKEFSFKPKPPVNTVPLPSNTINTQSVFFRGIYALYLKGECVYIGQSKGNVMERILKHYNDPKKIFDSFACSEYWDKSDAQLNDIEKKLIRKYKPRFNVTHKVAPKSIPLVLGLNTCSK